MINLKVLLITSFIPMDNASQAGIRITYNLIKTLEKEFNAEVDVVGMVNYGDYNKNRQYIYNNFYFIPMKKRRKIINIIKNIKLPMLAAVRYDCLLKDKIFELLNKQKYDYIICDYTQNSTFIIDIEKFNLSCKTILVEQDVSYLSYIRKYKKTKNILLKFLYYYEYKRLEKYELEMIKKFDYVITLNEKDQKLLNNNNVKVITPYINKFKFKKENHSTFNIMFWGAMNRKENEDAVLYFMKKIWPKVDKSECKVYIIGANPSKKIKSLASQNVIVTGFIDDPIEFFKIMDLSIVPLRLGAGIKIKVLESLAAKIPVVTTSIGAEGINLTNKENALITDSPDEFASYINLLKNNKDLYNKIRNNGYSLILNNYNMENNIKVLKQMLFNEKHEQ